MRRTKVVAAIDFGTHGSGYAWAAVIDSNKNPASRRIKTRTQWPGQPVAAVKNLTALLLDRTSRTVQAWGYEALVQRRSNPSVDSVYVHGFKMNLAGEPVSTLQPVEDPYPLIVSYLQEMYKIALMEIVGSGYHEDDIRWCLTVPAIWNEYQKNVMRKAAIEAGFPGDEKRLILALEPEAAAHYARIAGVRTLEATGGRRASLLSPGSRFMVADCGGGTVDLTAYRTTLDGKLVEIGRDFGAALGSAYLDRHFADQVLSQKFGSYEAMARIVEQKPAAFSELLASWERVKLNARVGGSGSLFISIPAAVDRMLPQEVRDHLSSSQDGVDDHIVMTQEEVDKVFEQVVPGILSLVDNQLAEMKKAAPTANPPVILLVGGFGSSPYLQERLTSHISGRAEVLIPPEPSVAVLYGAAHFAYDPQTRARRSRLTYGCAISMPFRKGVDPESTATYNDQGQRYCNNRLDAFVRIGQSVGTDEEVRRTYTPLRAKQSALRIDICQTKSQYPQYSDEPGVESLASLNMEFPKSLGEQDRKVVVVMHFGDTEFRVRAHIPKTGESVEAELTFDAKVGL